MHILATLENNTLILFLFLRARFVNMTIITLSVDSSNYCIVYVNFGWKNLMYLNTIYYFLDEMSAQTSLYNRNRNSLILILQVQTIFVNNKQFFLDHIHLSN